MTSSTSKDATPQPAPAPAVVSATPDASQGGPGSAIRRAREKLALTLEALAAQTRLARGTLEALERDDFGMLNEPVYVKGYYRKCAKVLGLSEAELIAAYERQVGPKQPVAPTKLLLAADRGLSKSGRELGRSGGGGLRWLWILIVAVLIGGGAFLLRGPGGVAGLGKPAASAGSQAVLLPAIPASPAPPDETPNQGPTATAPGASEPATEPAPATAGASDAASPSAGAVGASEPVSPKPAQSSATTPASASAVPPAPAGSLSLSFSGTSWVRIEDADGKLLLSGVIQSGDHQVVTGKTPYSLFLGNAPAVKVSYDGRLFDVAPFTKQNSTARFSVPQP